jgi:hypothetical protein
MGSTPVLTGFAVVKIGLEVILRWNFQQCTRKNWTITILIRCHLSGIPISFHFYRHYRIQGQEEQK